MSTDVYFCDFETYSECDLTKEGAHKYAVHPSTDVLCLAYAKNQDPPKIWIPGQSFPLELALHVSNGGTISAWNANFERLIWRHVLGPKYHVSVPELRQYECTMVRSYAMGFPGALANAAEPMGLPVRKDHGGYQAMMLLCKPEITIDKNTGKELKRRLMPHHRPQSFKVLYDYCKTDVAVEQAASARLKHLIMFEQELWYLDQQINDHGVTIDTALVEGALKVVEKAKGRLDAEMRRVTGGAVRNVSQVSALKLWLAGQEVPERLLTSLDKEHILALLARDDIPPAARRAIEIRQEAALTSTAKLDRFTGMTGKDGTIKGTIQFHGASTGRDAARGVQVQNFPRPKRKGAVLERALPLIRAGDADSIELLFGPPMSVVSDSLRMMIVAPEGHDLFSGDLSQIEARMTASLSGQDNLVEAFKAYDRKEGPDIYSVAAAGICGVDYIDPKDPRRQLGKVSTLALGFGGGAMAFGKMAKNYLFDVSQMFDTVWGMASGDHQERATDAWESRGRETGMSERSFIGSELVKLSWRQANPDIVQYWKDMERAAFDAIKEPGKAFEVRGVEYKKLGSFLRCKLPSQRCLYYCYPAIEDKDTGWLDDAGEKVIKPSIRYYAWDTFKNAWCRQYGYGGFLVQNVVQAAARDVCFEALWRLTKLNYQNTMRVHDELVLIRKKGEGSIEEVRAEMCRPPKWLPELPVAADVWSGPRYRK